MTRFTPSDRAKKQRHKLVLGFAVGLALASAVWQVHHRSHDTATVFHSESISPGWTVRWTGRTWHGKPVYVLFNTTDATLQRVTVRNWSEELLPVLHVGTADFATVRDQSALSSPPYEVPPRQSLWFIGSNPPPSQFIVEWQVNGQHHHAYLRVASADHFEQHPVWQGQVNAIH
jgi:hypothetical protein